MFLYCVQHSGSLDPLYFSLEMLPCVGGGDPAEPSPSQLTHRLLPPPPPRSPIPMPRRCGPPPHPPPLTNPLLVEGGRLDFGYGLLLGGSDLKMGVRKMTPMTPLLRLRALGSPCCPAQGTRIGGRQVENSQRVAYTQGYGFFMRNFGLSERGGFIGPGSVGRGGGKVICKEGCSG